MRPAHCGITPEGWPCIGLTGLSALVFACIGCWLLAVVFLALCWFSAHFFRDPERVVPGDPDVAVSPADGKVIRIERRPDPFSGESLLCISIFMNVFSVHVNRSPVAARVEDIRYFPGAFVNAAWDKASTDNERCAYSLRDDKGKLWSMVQIAGLVARRIVCRVEPGDSLDRGQRYGMIRFGSRVDLYLPQGYGAVARIGQQVFAGQSIVARPE
ncbi:MULTISPECIES: phosphatidylserine decarboxylase family protein [unclassified Desulfovibrio]|uniref:phosphatidylserine decarboxylase family protein n=1 Tax=unclassified Desulfovibrio TaxID=2593640 RepID=UPI000F5FD207|nr:MULTISPECIES: phosphatidylserine decarboxylase family protein [unclassified Desulfovibrio]RRD70334.1 phosphatidylserine decarboxylase family protein [Desulfovibrio sp. OH1209_COT-279]RRD86831.1 phosphatidylserine decarboxylase family protein [Desulfovibrio sp. OH1186_COT-070]